MVYAGHSPLGRRGTRQQVHELPVGCIYRGDDLVLPGTHVYLPKKADPVELTKLIVSMLKGPRREDPSPAAAPALRLVDTDHPVDAEFVREPANIAGPGLLGQRHLDLAAFGQAVEHFGEPAFVRTAKGNAHVVADFGRVVGVTVRGCDARAVGLEPRVGDPIPGAGRLGYALLVHGLQVEIAAQHLVIKLHGLAARP